MKTLKLKAIALLFMLAIGMNAMAAGTVVDNPRFPRKALVAPDCMINTMINVVGVASGSEGMNCLLDENLDNYATLAGLAEVGVLSDPIVRVKDLENTYPAGTEAGFSVMNEAGKLLTVDLLKNVKIYFYLNGELQDGVSVEQSDKELLSIGLIQVGNNDATLSLSAKSTKPFDEIGLFIEGVEANVLSGTKLKYAFVGNAKTTHLIKKNINDIQSNHDPILGENYLLNDKLDDFLTIPAILLDLGAHIELSWEKEFPKGTKVGFKFDDTNLLGIELANNISIKLTDSNGNKTETFINGELLGISLIGEQSFDVSIQAEQKFNKAELIVKGLGIAVKARHFYYGYIEEEPTVPHHHNLNLSMNPIICPEVKNYQLRPSDGSVTWTLKSKPNEDTTVKVSPNGLVTNMKPGVIGFYEFMATAQDGCTETITLTKGIPHDEKPECNQPIADEMELSQNIHGSSGSLISISDLSSPDNVIDNDMTTCATYVGGLALVNNLQIIGVKKKITNTMWKGGKRVGFVVEMNNGMLSINALQFYRIRLYNNKTQSYVCDEVISQWNTISVGLIGKNEVQKVRFSIEVPDNIEFDEITLWKSGVADIQLNTLRIYGVFMEDLAAECDNPLRCSTIISRNSTGASINYGHTESHGVVEAGIVMKDLYHIIDDSIDTYSISNGIKVGCEANYAIKLGRIFDKGYQIGIIMEKNTYLANLNAFSGFTFNTYYKGQERESKKGWHVLGLDAIGYGDKIYLLMNPKYAFDEVRLKTGKLLGALEALKIYGLFVRNDADGDGIPDCEEDNCCGQPEKPGNLHLTLFPKKICKDNELTADIIGQANTSYLLSCPEQGLVNIKIQTNEVGEAIWKGIMKHVGQNLAMTIKTEDGTKSATQTFTVHPLQTTWQGKIDTDWNKWDNWTDGSPLGCTNVIIPGKCERYPILQDTALNLCNNIHFEMNGEVVNTHLLDYSQASVDLTLEADRYYMLSAPLHNIVTGDMFIPENGNPQVFTPANAENSPQNRFNPRIYQRLWETNAKGKTISADGIIVVPNETRWTPPFNILKETYTIGKGFSMKAEKGTATAPLTFRFPKAHTEYEYVTELNKPTGIKETIARHTYAGRFIYENGATTVFPLQVTLSNNTAGNYFLMGNPFMTHIDIQKFITNNKNIKSIKVYDGNTANSSILVDRQLLSNGTNFTHIAPMQSVFVETETANELSINVTFTADMLTSAPVQQLKNVRMKVNQQADLHLQASTGSKTAHSLIRQTSLAANAYVPGEDAELLIDNEVCPSIALFSVAGNRTLDIQQLNTTERIPLGFYMQKPDTVVLMIRRNDNEAWNDWYLSDVQLQKHYSLKSNETIIPLGVLSTNVGRFFLVKGNPAANSAPSDNETSCYCYREGTDYIVVRSANDKMTHCEIFASNGKLIDKTNKESMEYRLRTVNGVNIIKVYAKDKEPKVFKVSCY